MKRFCIRVDFYIDAESEEAANEVFCNMPDPPGCIETNLVEIEEHVEPEPE